MTMHLLFIDTPCFHNRRGMEDTCMMLVTDRMQIRDSKVIRSNEYDHFQTYLRILQHRFTEMLRTTRLNCAMGDRIQVVVDAIQYRSIITNHIQDWFYNDSANQKEKRDVTPRFVEFGGKVFPTKVGNDETQFTGM